MQDFALIAGTALHPHFHLPLPASTSLPFPVTSPWHSPPLLSNDAGLQFLRQSWWESTKIRQKIQGTDSGKNRNRKTTQGELEENCFGGNFKTTTHVELSV